MLRNATSFLVILLASLAHRARANELKFPDGFRWSVATSGHQIEGGDTGSDWADWEAQGHVKTQECSGQACDHWNRLREDTMLLKALHVTQYRFSMEWSKIEPEEGKWDAEALRHYREEVALLKENGIAPLITINHYTLPRWIAKKGGWRWEGMPDAFARYSEFLYRKVAPEATDWITLNEPMVVILRGYMTGEYPPGFASDETACLPLRHMVQAHGRAYHRLHAIALETGRKIRVGAAHHLRVFQPLRGAGMGGRFDSTVAKTMDAFFNWAFPDAIEGGHLVVSLPGSLEINEFIPEAVRTQDYFGLNYYSRETVRFRLRSRKHYEIVPACEGTEASDVGWRIYPSGLYQMLKEVKWRFSGKPIFITENGIADAADTKRARFLLDHLAVLHQAIQEGIPVVGYCHWSLMDNFEWIEGFSPRYGLYAVDYRTRAPTLRESGKLFSKIAEENAISK
jgi:beta-glucosidase